MKLWRGVRLDSTYLNKKVYQLSGGKQQSGDSKDLLKPYELVLADEPTGNLDYKNKNTRYKKYSKRTKKIKKLSFVLLMIMM